MNERIKELAKQAQKVIWSADGNVTELTDLDIEKFAELIIRECAEIAKLTEDDDGDDYKSGRSWAGIDILKHFGVE